MDCFYSVITLQICAEDVQKRKRAITLHYIRLSEHMQ